MEAREIVDACARAGVTLAPGEGGTIVLNRPRSAFVPRRLVALVRDHKADVLQLLDPARQREVGRVPAGDTSVAHCLRCGLVWVPPSLTIKAPRRAGVPVLVWCPWCSIRKQGLHIPHPKEQSEGVLGVSGVFYTQL